MPEITFREGLRNALQLEMRANEEMVTLGESIATWGGASGVTHGLLEEFGADRVIETPVSENAIVGQALGLALAGVPVVAEVYSADFLFCAGSEVINDIAKWRFQHRWEAPINLVLRMPMMSSGIAAGPEHTQAIEGYLHRTNGLSVVVPGSPREAMGGLRAAIQCGDPVVFLEHRRLYDTTESIRDSDVDRVSDLAHAVEVKQGTDLTVVAWGWMRTLALRAAEELGSAGDASIEIVDPMTIKPMDVTTILESVAKTKRLLVVEEAPLTGSVAGEILARVAEASIADVRAARRLTMPNLPNPFDISLEETLIPDVGRIVAAIKETLSS
jgi:pyruvate/2-oxoglutarate/acetoin dehydrogenase E1 component